MNFINTIPLLALFLITTGCASMFSGTEQDMSFKSEPEGATVYVDGLEKGKTPLQVKLRKDEFKNVTFKKTGYHDEVITLHAKFDPLGLLNLLTSTGFTIDALTGAMFEYAPGQYLVKLKKQHHKVSPARLDRNYQVELTNFISKNYSILKRQCQTDCDNTLFQTLTWLITKVYKKDIKISRYYALTAFNSSTNPVEYLQQLRISIKSDVKLIAVREDSQ